MCDHVEFYNLFSSFVSFTWRFKLIFDQRGFIFLIRHEIFISNLDAELKFKIKLNVK